MPMVHSSRRNNFSFILALVAVGLLLAIVLPSATLATSQPPTAGTEPPTPGSARAAAAAGADVEYGERRAAAAADAGAADAGAADAGAADAGAADADAGYGERRDDAASDADAGYGEWRDDAASAADAGYG